MSVKTETKIVQRIIAWIKACGGDAWHVHGSILQRRGEPDIDGWLPGNIHLKLEVKTTQGKLSTIQKHRINRYKNAGYIAGCVTSIADVQELLKGLPYTYRTLVSVENYNIDTQMIDIVLPGWEADRTIQISIDRLPDIVVNKILQGNTYFHAKVNIKAKNKDELFFTEWELS